jgi:hypothetical protein
LTDSEEQPAVLDFDEIENEWLRNESVALDEDPLGVILKSRKESCEMLSQKIQTLTDVVEPAVDVVSTFPMALPKMRTAESLRGDLDANAQFGFFLNMTFTDQLSYISGVSPEEG